MRVRLTGYADGLWKTMELLKRLGAVNVTCTYEPGYPVYGDVDQSCLDKIKASAGMGVVMVSGGDVESIADALGS